MYWASASLGCDASSRTSYGRYRSIAATSFRCRARSSVLASFWIASKFASNDRLRCIVGASSFSSPRRTARQLQSGHCSSQTGATESEGLRVVQVSPILENDLLLKRAVSGHWPPGVSILSFMVVSSHHRRPITARMSWSTITTTRDHRRFCFSTTERCWGGPIGAPSAHSCVG